MAANSLVTTPLTDTVRDVANGASRAGLTVTRIIGHVATASEFAGTAPFWSVGIFMARPEAAASVDPAGSAQQSWMYWTAGVTQGDQNIREVTSFDLKGKRQFRGGDDELRINFKNQDLVDSLVYTFALRVLYLLP